MTLSAAVILVVAGLASFATGAAIVGIWRRRVPVADRWAQTAFVLVVAVGLPLAAGGDVRAAYRALRAGEQAPTKRVVTEKVTPASESVERTVSDGPPGPQTATKTVTSPGVRSVETVTTDDQRGTWELILAPGSLLLSRGALTVLIAFLVAASVQRMLLGEFAVKVGQLDIPVITRAAVEAAAAKLGQGFLDAVAKLESPSAQVPIPEFVWARETRLRFIAFYIELQQAIRHLAERSGIEYDRPPVALVETLQERGVITSAQAVGYVELLRYGSKVTEGAPVDEQAEQWLSTPNGGLAVLYQLNTTQASSMLVMLGLRRQGPVPGLPERAFGPVGPPVAQPGEEVMVEVSLRNTSGVTITRVLLTDASTDQLIADSHEPAPPRANQSFTTVTTVPPGAVDTWRVGVVVAWEDENAFRGRRTEFLTVRIEAP